jgi:L-ascorbate metabolism protein UlaG (beta-lactamase superfamily)
MRKAWTWLLSTVVAGAVCANVPAFAQTAYLQKSNADHMKDLAQKQCSDSGDVTLTYYGFMAFLITSPCGLRGMFDPWRDAQAGLYDAKTGGTTGWDKVTWMEHKFPRMLIDPKHSMVDYAVSTHAHFDHDGLYQFDSATVLDRMTGEWQFADVKITGLSDMHACGSHGRWPWSVTAVDWIGDPTCTAGGPTEDDNNIYYIEVGKKEKITLLHWGDNNYKLLPQNQEFFKTHPVDVVIVPVDDSGHIVGPDQIKDIVQQVKPKVIIPSHYFIKGIVNPSYTVLTPDRWFVAQKHKQLTGSSEFKLSRKWLDGLKLGDGEFLALYFENNVAFKVIDIPDDWEDQLKQSEDALAKYKASKK